MYLSKAGSAGSLHLVFLAEVLVMSVQDTAWEAGPGYHLIVLTQPANTMQRKVYELVVVTCAYVYGCVRSCANSPLENEGTGTLTILQ